jgi:hypothetical protein
MLLNSWPSRANSSRPAVGTADEKSPPASRRAASRNRDSWPCSAREASSEKKNARIRNPAMNTAASARSSATEPPVAARFERTETATVAWSKPAKPDVATR